MDEDRFLFAGRFNARKNALLAFSSARHHLDRSLKMIGFKRVLNSPNSCSLMTRMILLQASWFSNTFNV